LAAAHPGNDGLKNFDEREKDRGGLDRRESLSSTKPYRNSWTGLELPGGKTRNVKRAVKVRGRNSAHAQGQAIHDRRLAMERCLTGSFGEKNAKGGKGGKKKISEKGVVQRNKASEPRALFDSKSSIERGLGTETGFWDSGFKIKRKLAEGAP